MKVYFFDNSSDNLMVINRCISQWDTEGCEFFLNKSPSGLFERQESNEETVIFINTRMHSKKNNSFEFAMKIREKNELCHIVFISSFPQDMSFCFKNLIRPSGFLLKPLDTGELTTMLRMIHSSEKSKSRSAAEKIHINSGCTNYFFYPDEILYFTTLGKKLICITAEDKTIEFYGTLKDIENRFSDYFIRCHSGFLANKKIIVGLTNNTLLLKNCAELIPVSKKYRAVIRNYFKSG